MQGPVLEKVDMVVGSLLGRRENWGMLRRALNPIQLLRVGIPVVSLGVATGTGEAWGSTGFSMPFGSASVTALGVVKCVPMSRSARTHL